MLRISSATNLITASRSRKERSAAGGACAKRWKGRVLGPQTNPASPNYIVGTEGSEDFTGRVTDDVDVICGFGGDDTVQTLSDGDVFLGGAGRHRARQRFPDQRYDAFLCAVRRFYSSRGWSDIRPSLVKPALVFDRDGIAQTLPEPRLPPAVGHDAAWLSELIYTFIRALSVLPMLLERGELVRLTQHAQLMKQACSSCSSSRTAIRPGGSGIL